jgi:O-antigen/teichoic acid export membrane protein
MSIGRATAAGMAWTLFQNVGSRFIGFFSQLVIAAILSPKDFGVIGLTYTVSSMGALLVGFGVDLVVLQRNKAIGLWLVPVFWATFGLGLAGGLLVVAIGPLAAMAYDAPGIPALASIIALSMPITALATVPTVLLRSQLNFRQLAAVNLYEVLGIQGLTIALAYAGAGPFAFVIPLPTVAVFKTIALWLLTRPDMRGGFGRARRAKFLIGRSVAVFGTILVQTAISQGDYMALGLRGDAVTVGLYFFALKLASQPLLLMAASLSAVLLPALSKLRNTPRAQGEAAFRAAKILGLLIMPAAFLQAGLIGPAIHIFFPSGKWNESIPLMQILSIGLGFNAIAVIAATLQTSRGGFRQQLAYTAACAPVFFCLVLIGAWRGSAVGAAIAVAIYYVFVTPIYSYVVFQRDGVKLLAIVRLYIKPALVAGVAVCGSAEAAELAGLTSEIGRIIVVTASSGIVYAGLLRFIDPAGFKDVLNVVRNLLNRSR